MTPSTWSAIFCALHTRKLTPRQQERLREAFTADEAHISVEVANLHRASARGLPPSHTRPRPTPGHTPHPAPTSLPHPRNRTPRGEPYANGRTHSTPTSTPTEPATHPTEAINGHYRTRKTHRQRLPQPHQLPTPNAPHRRRPRRLHPHSTLKSPITVVQYDFAPLAVAQSMEMLNQRMTLKLQSSYRICRLLRDIVYPL